MEHLKSIEMFHIFLQENVSWCQTELRYKRYALEDQILCNRILHQTEFVNAASLNCISEDHHTVVKIN
jgi:hypothetical protein